MILSRMTGRACFDRAPSSCRAYLVANDRTQKHNIEACFNQIGREGWEIVNPGLMKSQNRNSVCIVLIFKEWR
jgi:hypothetical protein